MILITDQFSISLPLPDDARLSNVILNGSTITIETIEEYLLRVDYNSRYLGQEVLISTPPGDYSVNNFVIHLGLGNIYVQKHKFVDITDNGLVPVNNSVVIINDLVTGGTGDALSAEQGIVLKNLIDSTVTYNSHIELLDTPSTYSGQKGKIEMVNDAETGLEFIDRTIVFDQGLPSTTWNISHSLKKYPSVTVKNSAGDIVEGFINYTDKDNLTILFNSAFSGSAVLN